MAKSTEEEETPEFGNLLRRNIDFKKVDLKDPSKFNGISPMMKLGNTPKQDSGFGAMKFQTPKVAAGTMGQPKN